MRLSRPWSILLRTGAATAMLASALVGSPAHAAASTWFSLPGSINIGTAGAPDKLFRATWSVIDATKNASIAFDLSGIEAVATATIISDGLASCVAVGPKVTCELPIGSRMTGSLSFILKPKAGAKAGDIGTFTHQTRADDVFTSVVVTRQVYVKDGHDLVMVRDSVDPYPNQLDPNPIKPGAKVELPPTIVANVGNRSISGIVLTIRSEAFTLTPYSTCSYTEPPISYSYSATCVLPDLTLEPGDYFEIVDDDGKAISATATRSGFGVQGVSVRGEATEIAQDLPDAVGTKRGVGKPLTAVKVTRPDAGRQAAVDIDNGNNYANYQWTIENDKDLAAVGAAVTARIGDEVTIKIGAFNSGTEAITSIAGEPVVRFNMRIPGWAQVISAPPEPTCKLWNSGGFSGVPNVWNYWCVGTATQLGVGESELYNFRLKVVNPNGFGSVAFKGYETNYKYTDTNLANNSADITLTIADPAPSGTPSASPVPGGPSSSPVISGSPVAGGGLPVTGTQITLIAGSGALLAGIGAVLFVLSRRRRVSLTDEA